MQTNLLYLLIGTVLAAILAWLFRVQEAKKNVRLKDMRAHIDAIYDHVESINELSTVYFLSIAATDEIRSSGLKIKLQLQNIGSRVNTIRKTVKNEHNNKNPELLNKLVEFRRAITYENFDNSDRCALQASDPKFMKIFRSAEALKSELEQVYNSQK
jgi:hypothetical protein